jgi:ATP-binding cassette subfamily B protein
MPELSADHVSVGYDSALLRRLLHYLRPYRWQAALALLCLMASAGLALVNPLLTERALDVAVPSRDFGMLRTLALIALGALLFEFVLEYVQALVTTYIGQRVMRDLRLQIFEHMQRLSIPYFDRNPVGRLMTRVTSDVETLNELFSSGVVTVFGDLFTLAAIMVLMLVADWRLALVAFSVIPFVYLLARVCRRRVRDAFRDIRLLLARLNSYLQEHLSGMRVVQLFAREPASAREFGGINEEHLRAHLRSVTIYALFFPAIEILTAIALALVLWYGGLRTLGGTLTIGVLAAFIQLTRRFFQPLQDLSEKFNLLQAAMALVGAHLRLLNEPVTVTETESPRLLPEPVRGEVKFESVWFRYSDNGPWVLSDVSFTPVRARRWHCGTYRGGEDHHHQPAAPLYEPTRGRITVDGVTFASSPSATCAGWWVTSSRTSFSSPATSSTTSRSMRRAPRPRSALRRSAWGLTASCAASRTGTGMSWGNGDAHSASVSVNC